MLVTRDEFKFTLIPPRIRVITHFLFIASELLRKMGEVLQSHIASAPIQSLGCLEARLREDKTRHRQDAKTIFRKIMGERLAYRSKYAACERGNYNYMSSVGQALLFGVCPAICRRARPSRYTRKSSKAISKLCCPEPYSDSYVTLE